MLAASVELPHSLVASHMYLRASLLLMFKITNMYSLRRWPFGMCTLRSWPLSVLQDTIGEGIPDTLHRRVTLSPSVTVLLSLACIDDGTAREI